MNYFSSALGHEICEHHWWYNHVCGLHESGPVDIVWWANNVPARECLCTKGEATAAASNVGVSRAEYDEDFRLGGAQKGNETGTE